ncbi:hypothetical protein CCICO_04495 [Corynebacterium ciconiae DSM 44920]|uniref:hypothetical protein n=1 Tax=Corynebacterium ciconiae TaxID=227319 RepID=UPI0026475032|nr:hypothetical protein [Corynebacterium ciconiae]WKD60936.1 hypothetical protein CCICO_04495 [Corynebacterium ciconiae DSM 44920]
MSTTYTMIIRWTHQIDGAGEQILTDSSLDGLVEQIIAENDIFGDKDLAADFWPEVYWADPSTFTLDEGEDAPERREVTEEIAAGMAARVWDTPIERITIKASQV